VARDDPLWPFKTCHCPLDKETSKTIRCRRGSYNRHFIAPWRGLHWQVPSAPLISIINIIFSEGAQTLAVPWFLRAVYRFLIVPLQFVPVDKGVYTSLFAAAGKKVKEEPENYRGAYLHPVAQLSKPSADSLREDLADDLWKLTNQVLKDAKVL